MISTEMLFNYHYHLLTSYLEFYIILKLS